MSETGTVDASGRAWRVSEWPPFLVKSNEERKGQAMAKPDDKSTQVAIRMSKQTVDAIDKAIKGSPIEFQTRSDFVKRAIENELRRRGLVKTYKD